MTPLFAMRAENLYELIYAIIAELLLKKGDIVNELVKTFRKRFGVNYNDDVFGMNEIIGE